MAPRVIRRSDGLVEIRRRRARDLVLSPVNAVLAAMMLTALLFLTALVAILLVSPILAAIAGGLLGIGAWGSWLVNGTRDVAPAPVSPVPPRPRRAA
jgi:hypothetical protein